MPRSPTSGRRPKRRSLLIEAFYGVNLIHDVGYLESGKCNSFEQLVICDEIIYYIKRFMQGLDVSDETPALDLIYEVGHGGDFFGTEHTLEHFCDDWYPKLFDRNHFEGWATVGSKTLRQRSRKRIEKMQTEYRSAPLPPDVQQRIDRVMDHSWRSAPSRISWYENAGRCLTHNSTR